MIVKIKTSELRQIIKEEWERSLLNELHSEEHGFDSSVAGQDPELDYEGYMTKSQLFKISKDALELHNMIKDGSNLPEWMQTKIAQMIKSIDDVKNALEYDTKRGTV